MLSNRERLAAIALARMAESDREHALKRGYVMVNLTSEVWTPVNIDAAIADAAQDFRRAAARTESETPSAASRP